MANLKLYASPITRSYALGTLTLPQAAALPPLRLATAQVETHTRELSLETLAAILQYAAGEQLRDGGRRRIAPSGGSLRSCSFYLLVNNLPGLAPGLYLHDGQAAQLIPLKAPSLTALRHLLYGVDEEAFPVSMFATSHLGRVRAKYMDFGYNLVQLDAGIACEYAVLVARSFGVLVWQPPIMETKRCAELLRLNRQGSSQIVSAILHLGARSTSVTQRALHASTSTADSLVQGSGECYLPSSSWPAHTQPSACSIASPGEHGGIDLASLLLNRKATYVYGNQAISASSLAELVAFAHRTLTAQHQRGLPKLKLWPMLLVLRPDNTMVAGIYDCRNPDPSQWVQRAPDLTPDMFGECFNQRSFQKASAALVFMADLEHAFAAMGPSAYRSLLQQAGGVVASTWLEASAAGLVGCSVGGMIEAGFVRFAETDGYRETPLFSLVLALPAQPSEHHSGEAALERIA